MKSDQKGQMVQTEKEPMGSKVLQEGSKLRKLLIQKQEIFLYPKGNCQAPRERTQLRTMDCFIVREQSWGLIKKYSLLVVKLGGLKTWPKCIAFYSFFYPPLLFSPLVSFLSFPFPFFSFPSSPPFSFLPFLSLNTCPHVSLELLWTHDCDSFFPSWTEMSIFVVLSLSHHCVDYATSNLYF